MEADMRASCVLVIDDEPGIRRLMTAVLTGHGYSVREVATGRAALDAIASDGPFAAIVCDLGMPDLNGEAVYEAIKSAHPELVRRLVFMSGGTTSARAQAFLERPDVVVIYKPFELPALLDAIARAAG